MDVADRITTKSEPEDRGVVLYLQKDKGRG